MTDRPDLDEAAGILQAGGFEITGGKYAPKADTKVSGLGTDNLSPPRTSSNPPSLTPDTKALREGLRQIFSGTMAVVQEEDLDKALQLITSKVISELESLNKKREYQVRNHGLVKDTQGREFEAIQMATDSWENTIKLRIKELSNTLKEQEG